MQSGGAERIAALLCNHWVAQGHDVTLMPTFSGRGDCQFYLDQRVKLDYLADHVGKTSRNPRTLLQRFFALRTTLRVYRPDVVVSFLTQVNIAALLAAIGLAVPVVVSERIYPPMMPMAWYWRGLRRLLYPNAKHVVVQTEQILEWIRKCCPTANGRVIPNPVVYPLPSSEPALSVYDLLKSGRQHVIAAGRLDDQKGFNNLIRAFVRLRDEFADWDLVILGEGEERLHLEVLVRDLGLQGRVYLPGRVGNVSDWYESSDLYVMSSRFEGFPNTLVEAMAHGLPVVSVDCPTGPRDIIHPGVDGLLVDPGSGVSGLAHAMGRLMADDELRQAMKEQAVKVRERYSIERIGALWDEVLGIK